ncbi:erv26 super protein [Coemansia sp. Benny D115]|nr:erv26 super protein [Coemansia sp. Benny D115]
MLVLAALALGGWVLGVLFAVFSVACGLYIISEWVEEHPRQSRRALQLGGYLIDLLLMLAALGGLSLPRTALSLASNHVYLLNLHSFPLVSLTDPAFLASCALVVTNHFAWFVYFMARLSLPFGQVCAFMFFCVWMLPLGLFVSLTPLDSALPGTAADGRKSRRNMFRALLGGVVRSTEPTQPLHTE